MDIRNCIISDADAILKLYVAAMQLQTEKKMVVWPQFEKAFIEKEIEEKRQWKLVSGDEIACNWAITFDDKQILGERDDNNSIYIHRIATNPKFRGNRFVDVITAWARNYAKAIGRKYIRLDTLGNNVKLIEHYTSAGFHFLGITKLENVGGLPGHYQQEPNCCRFEIELK
jgi:ribosomal protein S18 acetylase RimI-like enzyme